MLRPFRGKFRNLHSQRERLNAWRYAWIAVAGGGIAETSIARSNLSVVVGGGLAGDVDRASAVSVCLSAPNRLRARADAPPRDRARGMMVGLLYHAQPITHPSLDTRPAQSIDGKRRHRPSGANTMRSDLDRVSRAAGLPVRNPPPIHSGKCWLIYGGRLNAPT